VTGVVSATLGGARRIPAVVRTVGVGLLTMALTFATGTLVGDLI